MTDKISLEIFQKHITQRSEVERYIKETEEKIKPLRDALKNLKAEKKTIDVDICKFMGSNRVEVVNLPHEIRNGLPIDPKHGNPAQALKYSVTETVETMNKENVRKQLLHFFIGPGSQEKFNRLPVEQKTDMVYKFIYDKEHRPKKLKESLRKVKFVGSIVEQKIDIEVPLED